MSDWAGLIGPPASPRAPADWLKLAIDQRAMRPRLAPDVELARFDTRWGSSYSMIRNPRDNLYFRLDGEETLLAASFDGSRTVAEIAAGRLGESGQLDLERVRGLVDLLHQSGFLDRPFVDTYTLLRSRTVDRETGLGRWMRNLFKTQTIRFPGAPRLADLGYRMGGKLIFTWPAQILFVGLLIFGPIAFYLDIHSRHFAITGYRLATGALILFLLDLTAILIHEAGHALAIRHAGRQVLSAGFQLYLGHPAFFIDSADILMAPPRDRIRNSWYGPYMSLVVSGLSAVMVYIWPSFFIANILFQLSFLNYFGGLLNLIPFLELDGYWIITDALELPDLLPRSLAFMRHGLVGKIRRRQGLTRTEWGLAAFASVALIFTVVSLVTSYFLLGPLLVRFAKSMWKGGWLTRVLLIALSMVVFGPLVHGLGTTMRWVSGWIAFWGHRLRFRAQRGWRVEVGLLIDKLPVLGQLPIEDLNQLAGVARLARYAKGRVVVRQGQPAHDFFVVRTGTLAAIEERENGSEHELRRLIRGAPFGEVALLDGTPRTATVRALTACELFVVARGPFERMLAGSLRRADVERTVQQLGELRALQVFRKLSDTQLAAVADAGAWVLVPAGDTIVGQGGTPDAFFAIGSGQFEVTQDGKKLRLLGPGEHFGELALLQASARTAAVKAITPGRLFRLDAEGFNRLVAGIFRGGAVRVPYEAMRPRD